MGSYSVCWAPKIVTDVNWIPHSYTITWTWCICTWNRVYWHTYVILDVWLEAYYWHSEEFIGWAHTRVRNMSALDKRLSTNAIEHKQECPKLLVQHYDDGFRVQFLVFIEYVLYSNPPHSWFSQNYHLVHCRRTQSGSPNSFASNIAAIDRFNANKLDNNRADSASRSSLFTVGRRRYFQICSRIAGSGPNLRSCELAFP